MGPPEMCGYPHAVVALAEGLRILGVPFFANRNHWKEAADSEQTLFVHDPEVGPDDCSVVVLDNCWTYSKSELPALALHRGRRFKSVYFDFEDGFPCTACGEEFRSFDRIFRAHWNYFVEYPSNFEPWVFGPTSRMIRETENAPAFSSRERSVFVSYRIGHPLRVRADHHFIETLGKHMAVDRYTDDFAAPADAYHWQQWHQTGRRHHPEYYRRLKNSQMCACFGGRLPFVETRRESRAYAMVDRLRAKLHVLPRHVVQWDSFRLWESWCAGAAAIHVDLEKYGARLPEMPRNWEHYVGIDFDHPRQAIERVLEEPETVEKVAAQGRAWALENYHPTRIARRFLSRLAA
ncbi:MAG: glycosyltransferase [Opitutaceae bacterium]